MMQRRAVIWGVIASALILLCAMQFVGRQPLTTDLLALLPVTERNPVAEEAVKRLADAAGGRVIYLIGHADSAKAKQAAKIFSNALNESHVFRQLRAEVPAFDMTSLFGIYAPYRFQLLAESDRRGLEAEGAELAEGRLLRRLNDPFHMGPGTSLEEDPFGFLENFITGLPLRQSKLELDGGYLVTRGDGRVWVMVSGELSGSSYDLTLQEALHRATDSAERSVRAAVTDVQILSTGTVLYAAAARAQSQTELDRIGLGSLTGISILLLLVFRSLRPWLLGLASVATGVAAATWVSIAVFGELHVLTLVFGASLIGEAIDYSIQYFAARLGAGLAWDAERGLQRVAPGLTVALATSVLGYFAIGFTPFPALRQIAVFAIVGLVTAYLTVVLMLPALLKRPAAQASERMLALPIWFLSTWRDHVGRGFCIGLSFAIIAASVPGWLKLKAEDDVRLLIDRPPSLVAEEQAIRHLTGVANSSQFFLVEGDTNQVLLQREEDLVARLRALEAKGRLLGHQALSDFVPSERRARENYALLKRTLYSNHRAKEFLTTQGFRDEWVHQHDSDFLSAGDRSLSLEEWLAAPLSAPFRHLWLGQTTQGVATVVMPLGFESVEPLHRAAEGLPGVTLVDKPHSVSVLFTKYRYWGGVALGLAMVMVYGVLGFRYGWRKAVVVMLPTFVAAGATLAVFGYAGWPVTLFNVMALLLVLGVGVNYSIFLCEGDDREAATLIGVLLSAFTTLLSFGLLAFSSMPALKNFGTTLALGVALAVLLAPMTLSFTTKKNVI